jgi:diamine N-acetyltransferase
MFRASPYFSPIKTGLELIMMISPNKPVIRHATEADAELIACIGARMFEESFGALNHPEDMAQYLTANFSEAIIQTDIADPCTTYLIAFRGDAPVGYAKLAVTPLPDCIRGPKPIELARIYLNRGAIGKGWGSKLMGVCIEEAVKAKHATIWLGVWKKNPHAVRFYKKWGFTVVGHHEFVVGTDIQNDFVMAKSILPNPGSLS